MTSHSIEIWKRLRTHRSNPVVPKHESMHSVCGTFVSVLIGPRLSGWWARGGRTEDDGVSRDTGVSPASAVLTCHSQG